MIEIETTTGLPPDGVILHPSNWRSIFTSKNADDLYDSGGPFRAPAVPMIWGIPVIITPAIAAGSALVGAFRSATQLYIRSGLCVDASNSHSDYFIKNLTAIRAERRAALSVYRPAALGKVTQA